mmetsp:Transcript_100/g.212  ORF Transcript_100/g.212 Transcript_100/m.212 type:complete len:624 (-) Transcript_100:237-2108(-)
MLISNPMLILTFTRIRHASSLSASNPARFTVAAWGARGTRNNIVASPFQRQHSSLMSASSSPSSPLYMSNPNYTNAASSSSSKLEYTPVDYIAPIIKDAHQTYASHITHPYQFRIIQLQGLERLVEENSDALINAIKKDLGQGPMYCEAFELTNAKNHARHAQSQLKEWMSTRRKKTPFPVNLNIPIHSELTPNPRGVATIITPWNMPVQMVINPLVYALAAGNVCVLKMSEKSLHSTKLFTDLLTSGKYVDQNVVKVINGGAEQAAELLNQRVDAIMYTGGGQVGKIVAKAAANNLTPVLLELGGKNPVFVTKSAHLPSAARRIAWGKIAANTGQMCICPDYVVVESSVKEEFTNELCKAMDEMFPTSSYSSNNGGGDVGKMISVQHAERVVNLLDSTCKIVYGGKHHDTQERFVAPTIVEAHADSTIMKEEIFGPLLALITVPTLDEGIHFVNTHYSSKGEHPLALYIFSKLMDEHQKIMKAVPSGTCAINDVLKQSANYNIPFGGIGTSGMGAYYGKYGFDFFSHYRGALVENNFSTFKWDPAVWLQYPPYDENKLFAFRSLGKVPIILDKLKSIIPFVKVVIPLGFALICIFNPPLLDALLELNLKTILHWISQILRSK